jgi:hypothetical protein
MTDLQLVYAGLHNRHIKFAVDGQVLSGVVVDDVYHTTGKSKRTDYTYIPTCNMVEWKKAEERHDKERMYSLSSVVDISKITWAARV